MVIYPSDICETVFFPFQSGVMSTMFARFHPNLIVGGTYCGQIVLWDNRSNKQTPVQRTPLSAKAHTVSNVFRTKYAEVYFNVTKVK